MSIISPAAGHQQIVGILNYNMLIIGAAPKPVLDGLDLRYGRWTASMVGSGQQPAVIGHRGMGSSFSKGEMLACVRENTIESFARAAGIGVDMVNYNVIM